MNDEPARTTPALSLRTEALHGILASEGLAAAMRQCRVWLSEAPDDVETLRHLGQLHAISGERMPALSAATRACELGPEDPRSWSDLGRVHALAGDLEAAVESFTRSIEADVTHADGWHNLGVALNRLGRREPAFTALKNALRIAPDRADSYMALGNLLIEAGQFEDAVECFERAAKHAPALTRARSRLAEELSQRGKVRRAEALFRQSLVLDSEHIEGWIGLARTLEDIGEAESALSAYANTLRRRPDHALALGHYLALLPASTDGGEWLEHAARAVDDDATPDEAKALIGYGLAKYHDRRGDFRAAAEAALTANTARRRCAGPLDREHLTARIDGIIATYTADFFADRRRYGLGADQPVFIVGLPRSGTTLTEQILSAHPMLHGAGELPTLAEIAVQCIDDESAPWGAATRIDETQSRVLAGRYLDALRGNAPPQALRISDKSPLNYFHLGLAALLFPDARIIHCRRAPRDNALSIWMENFNAEQRYATDFDDLAFFVRCYERLMAHWRTALPMRMLEIRYEDLVADVEGQSRRLMTFLGVAWDERCLAFHAHARAVQTPSRWQVRAPIYSHAIGRWKNYADHLPALLRSFDS